MLPQWISKLLLAVPSAGIDYTPNGSPLVFWKAVNQDPFFLYIDNAHCGSWMVTKETTVKTIASQIKKAEASPWIGDNPSLGQQVYPNGANYSFYAPGNVQDSTFPLPGVTLNNPKTPTLVDGGPFFKKTPRFKDGRIAGGIHLGVGRMVNDQGCGGLSDELGESNSQYVTLLLSADASVPSLWLAGSLLEDGVPATVPRTKWPLLYSLTGATMTDLKGLRIKKVDPLVSAPEEEEDPDGKDAAVSNEEAKVVMESAHVEDIPLEDSAIEDGEEKAFYNKIHLVSHLMEPNTMFHKTVFDRLNRALFGCKFITVCEAGICTVQYTGKPQDLDKTISFVLSNNEEIEIELSQLVRNVAKNIETPIYLANYVGYCLNQLPAYQAAEIKKYGACPSVFLGNRMLAGWALETRLGENPTFTMLKLPTK